MHAQVITFQLKDVTPEEYAQSSVMDAPMIAGLPGLVAKVWLASPETNTYGGMYLWRDRHSMEAFLQSDLIAAWTADPSVVGLTSRDYAVIEEPTRLTAGILAVPA
jgi:hypothetical protein